MFTKRKKIGDVYDIRKYNAHKKVIDWDAVIGAVILGLLIIGVIGMMTG